jgi:hypothetical protein
MLSSFTSAARVLLFSSLGPQAPPCMVLLPLAWRYTVQCPPTQKTIITISTNLHGNERAFLCLFP